MTGMKDLYGRPWSEPEYILVLDEYFQRRGETFQPGSEWVLELARIMGRTPASICMRMENFSSIDPTRTPLRRGLSNISPLCGVVFEEWVSKIDHLRSCAGAFRRERDVTWAARTLFEPDPVAIPRAFGRYELLDYIGHGAFGSVFSCVDAESGGVAALKIIHAERIRDQTALHRFLREIKALKLVRHANVIAILDDNLEQEKSFPGFVMELAVGSLTEYANSQFVRSGERPLVAVEDAVEIVRSICSACLALHGNSPAIVHRDINPNNILRLPSGSWVLADFSLAKFIGAASLTTSFATTTQLGMGTAYYAPPEQYQDFKRTDQRADIYALGVLLWELFTTSWPPPERLQHGLDDELGAVFLRATERDPARRFGSVREFHEHLEATCSFQRCRPPGQVPPA